MALLVDVITTVLIYSLSKDNINIRAAFLHNLVDALGSVAVIISGAPILLYSWNYVYTLCTLLISGYVLYHGYREMQSVSVDLNIDDITHKLEQIDTIKQVHHVHVWEIDEKSRSLEAHVVITEQDLEYTYRVKQRIKSCLANDFNITPQLNLSLITLKMKTVQISLS